MSEHPYKPQPWRLTDYYPESYARFMDLLSDGIITDWDDADHDRHEAQFRADLAAHDAELRAQIAAELIPTVAHKGPSDTDLDMLSRAATNLDQGYVLGGSNVTRAVAQLIHNAVTIARQEQP